MVAFPMSSQNASPRRVKGYGFPPSKGGPMFYAENYVGFQKQRGGKGGSPWALDIVSGWWFGCHFLFSHILGC